MPKYDYICESCNTTTEIEKSMDAPHPTECPECGEDTLRRIFNAAAFAIYGEHYRTSRPTDVPHDNVQIQPRSS
jgi:putative FmdB family regulatory protein